MKQILSILFGVVMTALTFLITRMIDREITLGTAREFLALGKCHMCKKPGHTGLCPACEETCLRVLREGGRTYHHGIR